MKSETWRSIRDKRIAIDDFRCVRCGSAKNLVVHHIRYPAYYGEEDVENDLVTLCDQCHEHIHGIDIERKIAREKEREEWQKQRDEYLKKKEEQYEARLKRLSQLNEMFVEYVKSNYEDICFGGDVNLCDATSLKPIREMFEKTFCNTDEYVSAGSVLEEYRKLADAKFLVMKEEGCSLSHIAQQCKTKESRVAKRLNKTNLTYEEALDELRKHQLGRGRAQGRRV